MPLYLPIRQPVGIEFHTSGTKSLPSSKCAANHRCPHPLFRAGIAHSARLCSNATLQEVSVASDLRPAPEVSAAANFSTAHKSNCGDLGVHESCEVAGNASQASIRSHNPDVKSLVVPAIAADSQLNVPSPDDPYLSQDFSSINTVVPSLSNHGLNGQVDSVNSTTTTTVITTTITTTRTAGSSNHSVVTTSVSIQRDSVSSLDKASSSSSSSSSNYSDGNSSSRHSSSCTSSVDATSQHSLQSNEPVASSTPSTMLIANPSAGVNSERKTDQQSVSQDPPSDNASAMSLWALFMLFISYVHQSASGSAVPAMLPLISPDLHLSDFQGALLTSGYSYLYAIALVPVGLAADKTSRPLLLSAGLTLWSTLTMKMGQVHDFNELLMARIGFAAAQATQNPISFALIPELFPKNKTTALAVYNCAIYLGRALSFAAVMLARAHPAAPIVADQLTAQMLPLDQLDLRKTSLLYTQGNMAAVLPIYDYNYQVIEYGPVPEAAWRHLLWCMGIPGLLIAGVLAFTIREPRSKSSTLGAEILSDSDCDSDSDIELVHDPEVMKPELTPAKPVWSVARLWSSLSAKMGVVQGSGVSLALAGQATAAAPSELNTVAQTSAPAGRSQLEQFPGLQLPGFDAGPLAEVWKIPAFRAVTFAAAMNDVGSYALIAWHSTFYERVFHLDSSIYAPLLATVMPIGGIIGGVGGGFLADYLDKKGGRAWMTVGASLLAAPFMAESLLAPSYQLSFMALLCGFAMSEAWRSPSAIMIRSIAPTNQASTATALYICIRNLVGGMGPLAVAKISEQVGLQKAMLLAPMCYLSSGLIFLVAEHLLSRPNEQSSSSDTQA